MTTLLILLGLVFLGVALGFVVAVSLGIRGEDRTGRYRSLRNRERLGPLARVGRRLVGLSIRPDERGSGTSQDDSPDSLLAV
ncbi:hypothetical protein J4H86_21925 [Spiractinospora alimapuensis]|uniref:hypothetical protein n=1 Tax=Spiractinospora alimapuensis TaxID=2820884 RepID=UPI001F1FBC72|nr:hypothetical protein [Spiractinospora alimapuensis]QVQ51432.1 hypothetical protein J4H86_21925 [Spiractinospora alimapuensis]